jgi:hypothetical protein
MHDTRDHHWLKQGSMLSGEVREVYDNWARSYDETLKCWDYRAPAKAAEMLCAVMTASIRSFRYDGPGAARFRYLD